MSKKQIQKEASEFGRAGGLAVSKNRRHMKRIGKKGAAARWQGHVKKNKK